MENLNSLKNGEYEFKLGCRYSALREHLSRINKVCDTSHLDYATDGISLYVGKSPSYNGYIRAIINMLCCHPHMPKGVIVSIWQLACDMATEYIRTYIDDVGDAELIRRNVRQYTDESKNLADPSNIYSALIDLREDELDEVRESFAGHDHSLWYAWEDSPHQAALFEEQSDSNDIVKEIREAIWPDVLKKAMNSENEDKRWSLYPGSLEDRAKMRREASFDFTRYLRRFASQGEDMILDEDSYDQIPYHYGLAHYGNLPLVEPLEYTDCFKVEDMVIAVDTSGSCSVQLVLRFLSEIRHILFDHDAFFKRMNVHIIQCDAYVREHKIIHSLEDFEEYTEDITIHGRRGTDFRPVFSLVDKLLEDGELTRLKGILYFTDGKGVYPEKAPEYEAAFVFSSAEALKRSTPEWVIPLVLQISEDFTK